ncbi:MAG: sensor histidine kinase [Patescibacteria group bacterium]|nr:sensor histidine kinase [Patescibacteria group bacterium]
MGIKVRKKFINKILLIFVLVGLLPLLIISASSLFIVVKTRQQNIMELQNLAINNVDDKVTKYLNEKMEGFNLVISGSPDASTVPVGKLETIDPNNLIFLIQSIKETAGEINKINFIDSEGDTLIQINNLNEIILKKYYPANIGLLYQDNIKIVKQINDNKKEKNYFKSTILGDNYFGPLEFIAGEPCIRMASQIKNQDGKIIGIISAILSLNPINDIVNQIKLGATGYVYLVDQNGKLISGTNSGYVKMGDNLSNNSLIKQLISGQGGSTVAKYDTYFNRSGKEIVFAGRDIKNLGWFAASEWSKDDAFSVIDNLLSITFLIAIGTLFLIIISGWFFAKLVEKPIKSLRYGAKHISEGDLDYRIRIKTGDEFEVLGNRFNDMIKILKENRKLRDEFVFIAAHELRTPVTAIKGYVSMILDKTFGDISEKVKENLLIISQSNERLVQLVQDLLEVARSEAGKMKIEIKDVSIAPDVETVINELKSLSNARGIDLIYKKPDKDILVQADSYKLKEVLTNFIGNAIKYTANVSDIIVSHEIKDGFLYTHVKDRGIGMTPEELDQLFSKFYRAQNDETKDIEGTGLGLFICKEIVERMGGKTRVESEKGVGSIFSFSLKLSK